VRHSETAIEGLEVTAYKIPTDGTESDGTLEWDSTTLVVVEVRAAETTGLGFSYASESTAGLIREKLRPVVLGRDANDIQGVWDQLVRSIRNLGRPGISSMAIAAVDIALWDLKARLLRLPLVKLLGQVRTEIPAYASGGFTSYTVERLQQQMSDWARAGFRSVKMKIGRVPERDITRVKAARDELGPDIELFVDANGAYACKQAIAQAEALAHYGVPLLLACGAGVAPALPPAFLR
jgi:L-alanine-DL-glutamate epimerase-like enolase superfamily enzyme